MNLTLIVFIVAFVALYWISKHYHVQLAGLRYWADVEKHRIMMNAPGDKTFNINLIDDEKDAEAVRLSEVARKTRELAVELNETIRGRNEAAPAAVNEETEGFRVYPSVDGDCAAMAMPADRDRFCKKEESVSQGCPTMYSDCGQTPDPVCEPRPENEQPKKGKKSPKEPVAYGCIPEVSPEGREPDPEPCEPAPEACDEQF